MKILVTGACGFIGHHTLAEFAKNGHEVIALDRLDETSTMARLKGLSNVRFIWHDLWTRSTTSQLQRMSIVPSPMG